MPVSTLARLCCGEDHHGCRMSQRPNKSGRCGRRQVLGGFETQPQVEIAVKRQRLGKVVL